MATPVGAGGPLVFAGGAAARVDVRSIEKELLALWRSAAEAGESGRIQPVTRAAVLTLVAVVTGDAEAARVTELIARVTEHAPCRALLVQFEAGPAGAPLGAWATAHCHRIGSGRQVCCEQVTIRSVPDADHHLGSLLTPLLIPDLPVFLYWPGAARLLEGEPVIPRGADLLCDLDPAVDALVLDSALARHSSRLQRRLLELTDRDGRIATRGMRPRDLNWARLLPWRESLADLVDEACLDLSRVERIEVCGAGGPAGSEPPVRPLLLLGWILDRLGWPAGRLAPAGDALEGGFGGGRRARVDLRPGGDSPGRLDSVTLRTADGAGIVLRRQGERFVAECPGMPGRGVSPLDRRLASEESLLCGELDRRGTDPVYRRALGRVTEILDDADAAPAGGRR